jgi:predicted small metal-binding protein
VKQFACGSVVPGCSALLEAETEEELIRKAEAHGREAHGLPEGEPKVLELVRANIREA